MAAQTAQFDKRLREIDRRHRKLSKGRKMVVDKTGLVKEAPKRQFTVSARGILIAMMAFFAFKGWLIHALGAADFTSRLDALAGGTTIEQLGAVVMRPDPAALWIAETLGRFF